MPAETIGYSQFKISLLNILDNLFSYLSFHLCFHDVLGGLRGKVPNRSLRGNKILLLRGNSSLGFEEMCDEIESFEFNMRNLRLTT